MHIKFPRLLTFDYNLDQADMLHLQDIIEQSAKGEFFIQSIGEQTIIQYLIEILAKFLATKENIYEEVNNAIIIQFYI